MKLLLAVDDSIHSEQAVEALCHIEWLRGSELIILNVVKPMDYLLPFGMDDNDVQEQELTRARSGWLDKLAAKISKKLPALKVSHKVKFGDTKFVIVNTAVADEIDLIVMVSCSVVEYAPCPVMIIKGETKSWGDFDRLFIAFDGSAYSHDALDWTCDHKWSENTKVHIVMTLPEFDTADAQNVSQLESGVLKAQWTIITSRALKMLEEAAATVGQVVGRENVTVQSLPGDPRSELLKAATKFGAQLIVMGSRGRTGLTKFLLGSVSLHLANHARIPIVIVRRLAPETLASAYAEGAQKEK